MIDFELLKAPFPIIAGLQKPIPEELGTDVVVVDLDAGVVSESIVLPKFLSDFESDAQLIKLMST